MRLTPIRGLRIVYSVSIMAIVIGLFVVHNLIPNIATQVNKTSFTKIWTPPRSTTAWEWQPPKYILLHESTTSASDIKRSLLSYSLLTWMLWQPEQNTKFLVANGWVVPIIHQSRLQDCFFWWQTSHWGNLKATSLLLTSSVTRKKLPNVDKSCPKMISPEKW